MAYASCSYVDHRDCRSLSDLLMNAMGNSCLSSSNWNKYAPMPWLDASVCK